MDRIVAVFEVTADMEEIGGRRGDRLVLRPDSLRPCLLQRSVDPHWAFDRRAALTFTDPTLPAAYAHQCLVDRLPHWRRPRHLRLV